MSTTFFESLSDAELNQVLREAERLPRAAEILRQQRHAEAEAKIVASRSGHAQTILPEPSIVGDIRRANAFKDHSGSGFL